MNTAPKKTNLVSVFGYFISLGIIALGQPARMGWLGAFAAVVGFAIFFCTLPYAIPKSKRFMLGAIWFGAIQLIQLSWMTSIEFQGVYILVVYAIVALGLACQFGLLTLLVPSEGKIAIPRLLCCAAFWTVMEWSRLFIGCGFSWNPIGLALSHFTPALQCTSLFGVFGLSFWVMLTNLWGVNVWRARFKKIPTASWAALASVPYLLGAAQFAYHSTKNSSDQINVALVQTALLPTEKAPHAARMDDFISPFDQWQRIIKALKEKQTAKRWDLIVLPEAAVPLLSDLAFYHYETIRDLLISELGDDIVTQFPPLAYPYGEEQWILGKKIWCVSNVFLCQTLANHFQAEIVTGLDHTEKEGNKNFNSAFYFKPHSYAFERYDKQILLPLAEYLPFDCLRPLTKSYGIFDFFTPGKGPKVFGLKIPFSVAICYEETFAEVMRKGREQGAKLFINVTNDNYYPHSTLHEQHFYHARLRAVENGAPLLRACNSGVTAAINSLGQTIGRFNPETAASRPEEGVLSCQLATYQYATLFSFWGEAGIVSLCLIALFVYSRLKSFRW